MSRTIETPAQKMSVIEVTDFAVPRGPRNFERLTLGVSSSLRIDAPEEMPWKWV